MLKKVLSIFGWKGSFSRKEYVCAYFVSMVIMVLLFWIFSRIHDENIASLHIAVFWTHMKTVAILIGDYLLTMSAIKRLRDAGKPWWPIVVYLFLIIPAIYMGLVSSWSTGMYIFIPLGLVLVKSQDEGNK